MKISEVSGDAVTNAVAIKPWGPNIRNELRALSQTAPDENKNNDCALALL